MAAGIGDRFQRNRIRNIPYFPPNNPQYTLLLILTHLRIRYLSAAYMSKITTELRNRLGDSKEVVRTAAMQLLQVLVGVVASPQEVFRHMGACFTHKKYVGV